MSIGAIGYMAVGVESSNFTFGVGTTQNNFIPFVSEGLQMVRDDIQDPAITGIWDVDAVHLGYERVEGNVSILGQPTHMGFFLRSAFDATSTYQPLGQTLTGAGSIAGWREHQFVTQATQFCTGSGSDLPTLTFEIFRGPAGVGSGFAYYHCAANNLEVAVDGGGLMRVSADFIGMDHGRVGRRSSLTFPPPDTFYWHQASISLGGTATPIFESLTFRLENNMQAFPRLDNRRKAGILKRQDVRRVFVNGTVAFNNDAEYDNFVAGTERAFKATFRANSPTMLMLDAPRLRYNAYPVAIGGTGRVMVGFTGQALFDTTSNYAAQWFLVNSRTSTYMVNTNA